MKSLQQGFVHLFLILILVLAGIGALGYFAFKNGQKITRFDNNNSLSNSPAESVNWKTHTDSIYKFSFEIPDSWEDFGDGSSNGYFKTTNNNTLSLNIEKDSSINVGDYLQKLAKRSDIQEQSYEEQQTNGISYVRRTEYNPATDTNQVSAYFSGKDFYVTLSLRPTPGNSLDPDKLLFDQILSTFKFIDEEIGFCKATYPIPQTPELSAHQNYSIECNLAQNPADCLKVDIYNKVNDDFSNSDGLSDCEWVKENSDETP